jgi:hypothetical protein
MKSIVVLVLAASFASGAMAQQRHDAEGVVHCVSAGDGPVQCTQAAPQQNRSGSEYPSRYSSEVVSSRYNAVTPTVSVDRPKADQAPSVSGSRAAKYDHGAALKRDKELAAERAARVRSVPSDGGQSDEVKQDGADEPIQRRQSSPPEAAVSCVGKVVGDACSIVTAVRVLPGVCSMRQRQGITCHPILATTPLQPTGVSADNSPFVVRR